MLKTNKAIIAGILLFFFVTSFAFAVPKEKEKGNDFKGNMFLMILQKLDLSKEQSESIQKIFYQNKRETVEKKAKLELLQIDLEEILAKDGPDLKKAEVKIREIEKIKSDIIIAKLYQFEKIKAVLTPEQKEKLKQIKEKMKNNFKENFKNKQNNKFAPKAQEEK